MSINMQNLLKISIIILFYIETKFLQSLHSFKISKFRDNHFFFVYLKGSIGYNIIFYNFINNNLHIIIYILFLEIEKLPNDYSY